MWPRKPKNPYQDKKDAISCCVRIYQNIPARDVALQIPSVQDAWYKGEHIFKLFPDRKL